MHTETRQAMLTHLLAAQVYVTVAQDLVSMDATIHSMGHAITAAQAELKAARHLLINCQVRCELDALYGHKDTSAAINRLSMLAWTASRR